MKNWVAVIALFLCACTETHQPTFEPPTPMPIEANRPVVLNKAQTTAIESAVRKGLKDPFSAQFERFSAARDKTGLIIVCGFVNSKNSFGGYVGATPFIAAVTTANEGSLIGMGGGLIDNDVTGQQCKAKGAQLLR